LKDLEAFKADLEDKINKLANRMDIEESKGNGDFDSFGSKKIILNQSLNNYCCDEPVENL
jgi:hypothetical protein